MSGTFLQCCSSTLRLLTKDLASAKTRPELRKSGSRNLEILSENLLFTFSETPCILAHATRDSSCVHIDIAASDAMAFSSRGAQREVVWEVSPLHGKLHATSMTPFPSYIKTWIPSEWLPPQNTHRIQLITQRISIKSRQYPPHHQRKQLPNTDTGTTQPSQWSSSKLQLRCLSCYGTSPWLSS